MAGAGGGQSGSESTQKARSGLGEGDSKVLSSAALGTRLLANRGAQEAYNSPFGYFRGQSANDLGNIDPNTGLPREATNAFKTMASDALNKYSAGGSLRGMNSPENTNQVVAGAMGSLGGQLIPWILDTKKYLTELPDQLWNNRLSFLNSTAQADAPLLGSESQGNASSSAWNANANVGRIA